MKTLGEGTRFKLEGVRLVLNGVTYDQGGSTGMFRIVNGGVAVPDQGLTEQVTPTGRTIDFMGIRRKRGKRRARTNRRMCWRG